MSPRAPLPSPASLEERRRTGLAWRRALVLALPVLYVAGVAVSADEGHPAAWLTIGLGLAVAFVGAMVPEDASPSTVRAYLWTAGNLAVALASVALSSRPPWAALLREIGALGAGIVTVRSIATIETDAGLGPSATEASTRDFSVRDLERLALFFVILGWGTTAVFDALAVFGVAPTFAESAPVTAATAGAGSLFGIGAMALLTFGIRRLELGAPPRALVVASASGIGLLIAITLAIGTKVRADAAAALGSALAAPAIVRLTRARDAWQVARRGRRLLTLTVFGGPVVTLAAIAASGHGASLLVLTLALGALAVGAAAPRLEETFLPMKGVLLEALRESRRIARDRDTRAAIANTLVKLREASGQIPQAGNPGHSPELWMLHPTRVCTVDAAGYLREREAELPVSVLDVAKDEPHRTVRVDVLRALEVRRADLRPLLRWLEDRGALFATIVSESDEPDGLLLMPAGRRSEAVTIEEIRAAKELADSFVAVCQARSAHERHLLRERQLADQVDDLDDELARLRHAASIDNGRHELASSRLARPATVGIYSAPSRLSYDALERRVEQDAPIVLVARAGIDPVPFIARAHLGGPRKEAPLVIVEGTSSREHDLERWKDERRSPLALADRGLLVLVDGAALPRDVQVLIARALLERRPPWEQATPLDVGVALTSTLGPDDLLDDGRLSPELHARFEDARPIELPGLHERAEDLFSIVADRLAREGLRVHGRPIGIDAAAYSRLVEHPFEGEDAELATIVTRLVARVSGDVVRAADVDALGIVDVPVHSERMHANDG